MKKLNYILALLFIFTAYLFSQTEGSETIKVDTVVRIDTIQIEEADTTVLEVSVIDTIVVAEPVNKQDEQTDLSKYNFYKDYLSSLQPKDTLLLKDCKATNIISARAGIGLFAVAFSTTYDTPISCNVNIAVKCFTGYVVNDFDRGGGIFFNFGVGLAHVIRKTDNSMVKVNLCPTLMFVKGVKFGVNLGVDVIFAKIISISPEVLLCSSGYFMLSFGINKLY